MQIHHYHPDTLAYVGTSMADPDPLETGRWLIPVCATEQAPPTPGAGQFVAWNGAAWTVLDIPQPPPVETPPAAP